jgi:hypothetical protein
MEVRAAKGSSVPLSVMLLYPTTVCSSIFYTLTVSSSKVQCYSLEMILQVREEVREGQKVVAEQLTHPRQTC